MTPAEHLRLTNLIDYRLDLLSALAWNPETSWQDFGLVVERMIGMGFAFTLNVRDAASGDEGEVGFGFRAGAGLHFRTKPFDDFGDMRAAGCQSVLAIFDFIRESPTLTDRPDLRDRAENHP